MDRRNGGRQKLFRSDSKLCISDSPFFVRHSCELEYMLRCKVKAEIEVLHDAEAADFSDIGSPSTGLPLIRYLAKRVNAKLRSSSIQTEF